MLKKIGYPKEPKLQVHRYIVQVITHHKKSPECRTKWHYCVNLKEVKIVCDKSPKGAVIEVFKAEHNFIQAYFKD
jgi:hypothetical protein